MLPVLMIRIAMSEVVVRFNATMIEKKDFVQASTTLNRPPYGLGPPTPKKTEIDPIPEATGGMLQQCAQERERMESYWFQR